MIDKQDRLGSLTQDKKMNSVINIQILDEAIQITLCTKAPEKDIYQSIHLFFLYLWVKITGQSFCFGNTNGKREGKALNSKPKECCLKNLKHTNAQFLCYQLILKI